MNKSPKLKPVPRPLFTCGIFRNCTQSVISPTAPPSTTTATSISASASASASSSAAAAVELSPLPPPPPPPPSDHHPPPPTSSSSSSSSTSPSFTQWRFPLHHPHTEHAPRSAAAAAAAKAGGGGEEVAGDAFRAAEAQFRSDAPIAALRVLERSLANSDPNRSGSGSGSVCPPDVMAGVTAALRDPASARPAAKVLLAMLLVEPNRRVAVEVGAVAAAVEAIVASGGGGGGASAAGTSTAERALAALELMCTIEEGSSEVRSHALVAPAISGAVEGMQGRGRECGIGLLAAAYGGERAKEAPEEVVRAVVVAMQGECTARGRRKGAMLMRSWQECGRLDLNVNLDGW